MMNKKAKTATQLATKLAKGGVVTFSFVKRNGSLRTAKATTELSLIPKEKRARITNADSTTSVKFFDTEVNDWRSVSFDSPIYF